MTDPPPGLRHSERVLWARAAAANDKAVLEVLARVSRLRGRADHIRTLFILAAHTLAFAGGLVFSEVVL